VGVKTVTVDCERVLRELVRNEVEFIIVGGIAAVLHGSARVTYDIDLVYRRSAENIRRLARALADFHPYLRGAPPGLPFFFDAETIEKGLNFTLTTTIGDVDVLGEVVGGGTYENIVQQSAELDAFGVRFRCVSLPCLIQLKRAAGRPKDLEAIADLQALLEERQKRGAH
jgi:predicted nucleotidyltransferase